METLEYPDYVSRFYDVLYAKLRSGVDHDYFLKKILSAKGPVLEVGTGTGRFFVEALERGADVYGVDVSANMLNRLKSKVAAGHHHRLFHQDVRTMAIPKKFELVVAPFRVFAHLLSTSDQIAALNHVHDHLTQSGRFIFDLYVPNLRMLADGKKQEMDFDGYYEKGKRLRRYVSFTTDIVSQLNHLQMTFAWDEDGTERSATWDFKMRYYFRYELELLIARSKLKLINIFGDYQEKSLSPESKDFVIVCDR